MAKKPTTQNPTFSVQQSTLNKALSICGKALSDNKILPVYEMFLFAISPGKLDVSACDGRIIISTAIEIQSRIDMKICIPGRKIADYIAKSANEILLFEIETHIVPESRETVIHPNTGNEHEVVTPEQVSFSLLVKGTSGKCTIPIELGDDFPRLTNTDAKEFQLDAEIFLTMLNKTMFAISEDQLRPSATGLNIRIEPQKVTATALDFNMVSTYAAPSNLDFEANFIIPKKALQQIQALAPTGLLTMAVSNSALSVSWGLISLTALLIDEKYPDYLSITPVDNHIDFVTSRASLIVAVKRVLPFADIGKLVKLHVSVESLLLTAENLDYSEEATEIIPGALANGEPILIGANGEYLLDILNSISTDEVWFSFSTPKRAMIVTDGARHVNPGKENIIILMPLFIAE
jgi:DNA polymerase-3 subunit beta